MRMSELSERSGISVASIKFYQREGLLPAGERTSANQASYDESHVERLRLVRALIEVGGLSVAAVRAVLGAADADLPIDSTLGIAQYAIPRSIEADSAHSARGDAELERVVAAAGWTVSAQNPGRVMAARVIDSYLRLDHEELLGVLDTYARAADEVARADLGTMAHQPDRAAMAGTVVVGTVLGDVLFAGLRRMAQESITHEVYRGTAG